MTLIQLSRENIHDLKDSNWVWVEEHDRCYIGTMFYTWLPGCTPAITLFINDDQDDMIQYTPEAIDSGLVKVYKKAASSIDFILDE